MRGEGRRDPVCGSTCLIVGEVLLWWLVSTSLCPSHFISPPRHHSLPPSLCSPPPPSLPCRTLMRLSQIVSVRDDNVWALTFNYTHIVCRGRCCQSYKQWIPSKYKILSWWWGWCKMFLRVIIFGCIAFSIQRFEVGENVFKLWAQYISTLKHTGPNRLQTRAGYRYHQCNLRPALLQCLWDACSDRRWTTVRLEAESPPIRGHGLEFSSRHTWFESL